MYSQSTNHIQSRSEPYYSILFFVFCVSFNWWFDGVIVFVVLGVSDGNMVRFHITTHCTGGGTNTMGAMTVRILSELNGRAVWESLNNFHLSI